MNKHFLILLTLVSSSVFLLTGCGDIDNLETPDTSSTTVSNSGVISHLNFSILASDPQPTVIDPDTGVFTKTDVIMSVHMADRQNQLLTNSQTVFFRTEYGAITPSCITADGTCSVTWTAIKRPAAGEPGSDLMITIVAYTIGEESFTDTNGNAIFDDSDTTFVDLEEPYVDADEDDIFSPGDGIIDVVNGNDSTGTNGVHDIGDGFFNGAGCTHSSLCSSTVITNGTIWDSITLKIDGPTTP